MYILEQTQTIKDEKMVEIIDFEYHAIPTMEFNDFGEAMAKRCELMANCKDKYIRVIEI